MKIKSLIIFIIVSSCKGSSNGGQSACPSATSQVCPQQCSKLQTDVNAAGQAFSSTTIGVQVGNYLGQLSDYGGIFDALQTGNKPKQKDGKPNFNNCSYFQHSYQGSFPPFDSSTTCQTSVMNYTNPDNNFFNNDCSYNTNYKYKPLNSACEVMCSDKGRCNNSSNTSSFQIANATDKVYGNAFTTSGGNIFYQTNPYQVYGCNCSAFGGSLQTYNNSLSNSNTAFLSNANLSNSNTIGVFLQCPICPRIYEFYNNLTLLKYEILQYIYKSLFQNPQYADSINQYLKQCNSVNISEYDNSWIKVNSACNPTPSSKSNSTFNPISNIVSGSTSSSPSLGQPSSDLCKISPICALCPIGGSSCTVQNVTFNPKVPKLRNLVVTSYYIWDPNENCNSTSITQPDPDDSFGSVATCSANCCISQQDAVYPMLQDANIDISPSILSGLLSFTQDIVVAEESAAIKKDQDDIKDCLDQAAANDTFNSDNIQSELSSLQNKITNLQIQGTSTQIIASNLSTINSALGMGMMALMMMPESLKATISGLVKGVGGFIKKGANEAVDSFNTFMNNMSKVSENINGMANNIASNVTQEVVENVENSVDQEISDFLAKFGSTQGDVSGSVSDVASGAVDVAEVVADSTEGFARGVASAAGAIGDSIAEGEDLALTVINDTARGLGEL